LHILNLSFFQEIIKINGETKLAITCNPKDESGCNDKEKGYIAKIDKKYNGDAAKLGAELKRLEGMKGNKMKPELSVWVSRRVNILSKLAAKEDL
jgi:hypothetical protein